VNKIVGLILALISPLFAVSVRAETSVPLNNVLAKTSIGSMAKFTQGMTTKIPPQAQSIFGGLTSINCAKGASPASCIPMAIWNTTFNTGQLTTGEIAQKTGHSVDPNSSLATATPWLSQLKISDALAANPAMASMPVTANGVRTTLGSLASSQGGKILGKVVDLRQTQVAQFPQIQNIKLSQFNGLSKLPANVIPNLSQLPITEMPGFSLSGGIALMKLDVIRTKERKIHHMVMSGSNRQPNAKCDSNCDYAEFHPWVGMPYLRGARIISGDSLSVQGGEGLLAMVNGGMEPTGVEANIGAGGVKFVIRNLNAKTGSATVNINFRGCGWLVGCTPYFLGIPLFTISERNNWFPLPTTSASVYRVVKLKKPF
jgi:hypothetical protein